MTWEFEDALHYQLYYWGVPYRIASGGTILVTFTDWFEENYLWNMTSKAIRKMIAKREGVPFSEVPKERYRSEERRVGKECVRSGRTRWSPYPKKKKKE